MASYPEITTSHTNIRDWAPLLTGSEAYSMATVLRFVQDPEWQIVRISMKGTTLAERYRVLSEWLVKQQYSLSARVQVRNYIMALKRGGLIQE